MADSQALLARIGRLSQEQLAATKACEWRRAEAAISELKDLLQTQVRRNPPDASALNPLIAGTVRDLEHATLARVEQERAATRDSIAKASIAYATRVPIPNTGVQSFPGGRSQSVPRPDVPTRHPARDALVQAPKTQRLSPQSASPQHSGAVHPAKAPRHDWSTCTRHRGGTAGSDDDDDDVCAIREPPNMGGPQGSHKIFSKKQRGGGGGDANWERGRGGVETAGRGSGDAPRREQQMGGFVSAGVRLDSENKRKGLPPVRRDSGDAAGGNGGGNGNAITRNGFVPPYVRKAFAGPSSGNGGGGGNSNGNGTGNGQAQRKQTTGQNTANDGKADEPPFCEQVMRRLSPNGEPIPDVLLKMEREIVEKVVAEILEGNSSVEWDSIAGLEHAKAAVQELAVWPLLKPELFRGARSVPRGLLLFGPPGTGKTLIGRAVASQCNATFFSISASSLTSKWIGEGEKMVKALFAVANCCEPAVIFVDEIDSLLSSRKAEGEHESSRRMKTEFLVQMDGLSGDEGRVLMIGATNRPQELDDGARRRLAKQLCTCWGFLKARHAVYRPVRDYLLRTTGNSYQYCGQLTQYHDIPLPCAKARRAMMLNILSAGSGVAHDLSDSDLNTICEKTHGYSGSDMKHLTQEAARAPLRELFQNSAKGNSQNSQSANLSPSAMRPITLWDFKRASKQVRPSVTQADIEFHERWNLEHGAMSGKGGDEDEDEEW